MHVNKLIQFALATVLATSILSTPVFARTTIRNICRLKGQEENTLQGIGIVVGLKGTGDGSNFLPTLRSLEKVMHVMGNPTVLKEIKDAKNVALVTVTATVPATGARQGDKIDCVVSSIGSCKSLSGGRLFITAMIGPDPRNPRVYAFSEGPITIEDTAAPNTGRIFQGCRLEEEFMNLYFKDNKITLVLDKYHADFQVAQDVAMLINNHVSGGKISDTPNSVTDDRLESSDHIARAINQVNIEVAIPQQYYNDPVRFVSQILALPMMLEPKPAPRVVINERAGSIVYSGDVEIGAVAVTHKNIVIETIATPAKRFIGLEVDPMADPNTPNPKLKALVEALNALHISTPDIIDIIKGLDKNGKLYAQLIIE
jgi:flagellar P-ring protein precursor FlgI